MRRQRQGCQNQKPIPAPSLLPSLSS